jgi:serine/threonine-protein kinase
VPQASLNDARSASIQRAEFDADVRRLRAALGLGLWMWMSFTPFDWLFGVVNANEPGSFAARLTLRLLGCVVVLGGYLLLRYKPPKTQFGLRIFDVTVFTLASIIVSLLCVQSSGLTSLYAVGIPLIMLAHSITIANHWKLNALIVGPPTISYGITMGLAAFISPGIAAQFQDPASLTAFAFFQVSAIGAYFFQLIGGHILWTMRRELLELKGIGRYKLERRLGKGGMGEVWAAYDQTLKRRVAIKIFAPTGEEPDMLERFQVEIRATAELKHPNTVRVFDSGTTADDRNFYAMEYLEGQDLARVVKMNGPLAAGRAARIIHQAARALAEAHGQGIVHRDIKPENLFLAPLGGEPDFVKVLDFGIAKVRNVAASSRTRAGGLTGTPGYIAPELILGKAIDGRSDIYSLGAVLYFLLAGKTPFDGETAATLYAHVHTPPEKPSQRRGVALPTDLENIVMRCLEKDPDRRFKTADELAARLATCACFVDAAASAAHERDQTITRAPTVVPPVPPQPQEIVAMPAAKNWAVKIFGSA